METSPSTPRKRSLWIETSVGAIRTVFGLVWAVDAYLKWQPGFYNNYLSYITDIASGQPGWLSPWFNFWINLIKPDPSFFSMATRIIETIIAAGLLLGLFRKWIYVLGGVFALAIWAVPEGFGGPYVPGSTDVGGGLIYVFLFLGLIVLDYMLGRSPYSIDFYIERKYPNWRYLAEWAPKDVLAQEPPYLPWSVQTPIIVVLIIMLVIFLILIQSQIKAAPPGAQASYIHFIRLATSVGA